MPLLLLLAVGIAVAVAVANSSSGSPLDDNLTPGERDAVIQMIATGTKPEALEEFALRMKFGDHPKAAAALNARAAQLRANQRALPGTATVPGTSTPVTPVPGDNHDKEALDKIQCAKDGGTWDDVAKKCMPKQPGGDSPPIPAAAQRIYTVREGDNPTQIAKGFTGDPKKFTELADANKKAPDGKDYSLTIRAGVIFTGQQLFLPASWPSTPVGPTGFGSGQNTPPSVITKPPGGTPPGGTPPGTTPPGGTPPATTKAGTYTVRSGDTFSRIASGFGRPMSELRAANPQVTDINKIFAGQVLTLPAGWPATPSGPTGFGPNVPVPAPKPSADQPVDVNVDENGNPLEAARATPKTYTVKSGDTFGAIAKRLGTTTSALKAANPQVKDINKINVGQVLNLP